jgi:hypothetical protein
MPIAEVLSRIAFAITLPTPVAGVIGMRPDSEPVLPPTPGARTGIFAAVGAGHFAQAGIATEEIEQGHRHPILSQGSGTERHFCVLNVRCIQVLENQYFACYMVRFQGVHLRSHLRSARLACVSPHSR